MKITIFLCVLSRIVIGSKNIGVVTHIKQQDEDDFLIRADKTPNSCGAAIVGFTNDVGIANIDYILNGINAGTIKVLYVLEDNIATDPRIAEALSNVELLIVHSSEQNETTALADVVLPSATFAEKDGTTTNFNRRVQLMKQAIVTLEQDRILDRLELSRWDKFTAQNDTWGKGIKYRCKTFMANYFYNCISNGCEDEIHLHRRCIQRDG